MDEIKKETETIRVIVEKVVKTENGKDNTYYFYKVVRKEEGGRIYKLSFPREVNTTPFEQYVKFEIEVDRCSKDTRYEYPKYWASGIHYDTLKPIVKR